MIRAFLALALAVSCLAGMARPAQAQASVPQTAEELASKRIGFYFGLRLAQLSFLDPADDIAQGATTPPQPGLDFDITGPQIDADFGPRLNLEFFVGFRLRDKGSIEATFVQWDERQDLFREAEEGKSLFNTLASPRAGIHEDLDGDGDVQGIEGGGFAETDGRGPDPFLDGAEDINYTGEPPDFIRFATSDRQVGEASADYKLFDVDYRRTFVRSKRFSMDWRAGLRFASLSQRYDIGYQQHGSFAVFIDEELDIPAAGYGPTCPSRDLFGATPGPVQDGDGDGDGSNPANNEADGDGFLDGNCNNIIGDQITSVATVSEDRIVAAITTTGWGLKAGLDARIDLSKKWRIVGAAAVSGLMTEAKFRYRETFTSERDRYLNFINWDFNGDGVYNILDLDFDGSCANLESLSDCVINDADAAAIGYQLTGVQTRDGIQQSVTPNPRGLNPSPYSPDPSVLRAGDPIGESERNTDILRETKVLNDAEGRTTGITPVLDLHLGFEWQFSRFAHFGFGLRSSTWFDAGKFRSIADDLAAGREVEADGDATLTGGYVTLTIVPR